LIGERAVTKGLVRDPISLTFWGFAFASVALLAVMPGRFGGIDRLDQSASMLGVLASTTAPVWVLVLMVVVLGTVVPFVLEVSALRHISATQVGLVAMLEPVLATIVAWLWLEQVLSAWQAIGVGVVVTGISLAQTARTRVHVPLPSPVEPSGEPDHAVRSVEVGGDDARVASDP
jgi:drug/metabolite transporter (DMT)-like permease